MQLADTISSSQEVDDDQAGEDEDEDGGLTGLADGGGDQFSGGLAIYNSKVVLRPNQYC